MKIKLYEMTPEQYKKWEENNCDSCNCNNCLFKIVDCCGRDTNCWVNHKDMFSKKFLSQEIEVEEPILTEKEKSYLESVIRPFKNKIVTITKIFDLYVTEKEFIDICVDREHINFPYFVANEMYKGMELGEEYTPKELGLFEKE